MEFYEKQKENSEMIKYEFEKIKEKIDANLLANPRFQALFENACNSAFDITDRTRCQVSVSEDGKTVVVTDKGKYSKFSRDNEAIIHTAIFLEGENLISERSFGITYQLPRPVANDLDAALYTDYENRIYDSNGIELSYSSYSDTCEYDSKKLLGNLIDRVLQPTHKPIFTYNLIPRLQNNIFCSNANAKCIYRSKEYLGIAYQQVPKGIKANGTWDENRSFICDVATEYPEDLRTWSRPIAVFENGEYRPTEEFRDKTLSELERDFKDNFAKGIETSKTKTSNPVMYNKLVEATTISDVKTL